MIRRAFTMRLKPGAMTEYRYHHDNIWPELVKEIEKSGIARIITFERDPDLFLFSEIYDEDAWTRLWDSEIHRKWGETMEKLMNFKDGKVDFGILNEIFYCEPTAAKKSARPTAARKAKAKSKKSKPAKKKAKK